jgi:serine/threonine-protein phosphatase 2A regulatory subunit A
VAVKVSS